MTDEVMIRELFGLDQMGAIFPLFHQVNHLSEAVFRQRLSAMLAQNNSGDESRYVRYL